MPVVTFRRSDLVRVIGRDVPMAELAERMPMLGGDVERVEGETVHMEWFPNRPDLLTLEGTGRALRAFLGVKPGLATYKVEKPHTELRVDPSVQAVRPFAALCFVRGVKVDDAYFQVLIDAQEKLTFSPGRRRRKVAIGIHDAAGLKGPFTYTTVGPHEKPFVPLGASPGAKPMTPLEVVSLTAKGQEYGHLLPNNRFPVFLDASGEVLSLPPVLNAQRTAVTTRTTDVLLDVTGTDARSVRQTIALLATSLAEHGGRIEAVTVHDASGTWTCPDLKPTEHVLHTDQAAALLGMQWSGEQVAQALRRMGHDADAYDNKVHVKTAAWRQDLLHEVDLLEDVAIGFGFESFPGTLPQRATFAGKLPQQGLEDTLRRLLTGHGYLEARTLTLSDAKSQWTNWGATPEPHVQLLNPVLAEQTLLRTRLLPSLLGVLAANRHRPLPQRLFETGHAVVRDGDAWRNKLHLALVECSAKAGFSDVKGLAEALVRDAALPVKLEPGTTAGLIPGRQGRLMSGDVEVGHFGELHPDTLAAFGLTAPAFVLEIDLSRLA
ncbi:MAG: phenylalanine--tRNA ligase subunit beta [Thermoplasmatota archaeon]|nr:phenylalanine--tRNA ligase subunit beta [Halobacteriales archaeon]